MADDNAENRESNVERSRRHLSKDERFPRTYRDVARVLKEVKTHKRSIKNAVYASKFPKRLVSKVLGLSVSVFKHLTAIDKILEKTDLLKREPRLNLESAQVMIHELTIKGNSLHGESKPVLLIREYEKELRKAYKKLKKAENSTETNTGDLPAETAPQIPRYVRVNTLLTTISDVITWFLGNGFREIEVPADISIKEYHNLVQNLKAEEFIKDCHFEEILAFPNGINFASYPLYKNGHIFLQDKSSCIPVRALKPQSESVVLDCCAAPGMKTAHLAALMNNKGKIIAFDRDLTRFRLLKETLSCGNVENCVSYCLDFLEADPKSDEYSDVRYILLDPSCSGSGMVSRMNSVTDNFFSKSNERIAKLSRFQILLLKHALSFPKVKRIVYSTCSTHEEENEFVIQEALQHFVENFKVVEILPDWPVRGSENFSFGNLCIRATPKDTLTNGFFVAAVQRIKNKKRKKSAYDDENE